MSIFNPSRGTGSFGKKVENVGSLFPVQAAVMPSTSSVNLSSGATSSQQQNTTTRTSSSGARVPQRASGGTVNTGRTSQTVSRRGTSSNRRSPGRGSSQSTNRTSSSTQRTPVQKRATAVESVSWAGPRSLVQINKQTRQIYRNNYKYFPMVSDRDLPQIKSAIKWNLFSKLVSDVKLVSPAAGTYQGSLEQISIPFFDALSLDLTRPTSRSSETQRAYESVNMIDTSHVDDIPLVVFDLLRGVLTGNGWYAYANMGMGLNVSSPQETIRRSKLGYLRAVTRQLRSLKSQRNDVLQAMFQLFMDAHFPTYKYVAYTSRELQRFAALGVALQPLSDSVAQSARRSLYAIWGGCFQAPQQMSAVTSPTFSKSSAQVSGGKAVLNTGGEQPFPLGDFLSAIASEGYLEPNSQVEGFGSNFYSQNRRAAKLDFSPIYKASTAIKQGFRDTLGLFVNASTMVKAYPQEIGTGNLAYRVARAQYTSRGGAEALRYFWSTGKDHPSISAPLKKQAPELGSSKNSSRFVDMSSLFSTLFLIDFMSCKDRKIVRSSPRTYIVLGTNHFGDHVRNFLNWIPQRAAFVINQAPSASRTPAPPPRLPSGLKIRMPGSSTSGGSTSSRRRVPSKGGKTKVGLTPVRSGKSMSPFRSVTAALARKQGKPTQSSPSRKFGIASAVDTFRQSRPSTDPTTTSGKSAPTLATVSDVVRILSEPNVKRTTQHVEIPLDANVVLEFGNRSLGKPIMRNFVDDVVLGMIGLWIAYPQMTKSMPQMLSNAEKLLKVAQSDEEFSSLSNGLEDMFGLDDPEFTKALMQLPRRSVAPLERDVILTEVELPSNDPSFDEVVVDVVVDPSTGDAVAVPIGDTTLPIPSFDTMPPQIQPSIPDIDVMPTDQLQPAPIEIGPAVEPPSGGGSVVAEGDADKSKEEKKPSAAEEEKTNYTPWIIGGVATVAISTGVFMYMNKRKQSI